MIFQTATVIGIQFTICKKSFIAQNFLYAAGNGGMLTYNISGATPSKVNCSFSGSLSSYGRYYGQTADYKRENFYVQLLSLPL